MIPLWPSLARIIEKTPCNEVQFPSLKLGFGQTQIKKIFSHSVYLSGKNKKSFPFLQDYGGGVPGSSPSVGKKKNLLKKWNLVILFDKCRLILSWSGSH